MGIESCVGGDKIPTKRAVCDDHFGGERADERMNGLLDDCGETSAVSALSLLPEWNNCHEAISYRTTISYPRDPSKPCNMESRKFLPLPKILRRQRSDAGIGPVEDAMEVDPAVSLRASESTPDLGIRPTTSGLSTPDDQESNGMRTDFVPIVYLTTLSRII